MITALTVISLSFLPLFIISKLEFYKSSDFSAYKHLFVWKFYLCVPAAPKMSQKPWGVKQDV